MSRSRNIKPGFFKNEILVEMPPLTRLLFVGLWCEADREGRLEYRPKRIKVNVMPYDDGFSVENAVAALVDGGFIHVYDVDGKTYLQILNWSKHQNPHHKEVGSVIPPPSGHSDLVCAGYIPLSNTIRTRIYARDGRVCRHCGATEGLSIDHIRPVSKGGNSVDDNLQVLCLPCNSRKNNKFDESSVHDPCMNHARPNHSRIFPSDSLIPDSLIPDTKKDQEQTPSGEEPPAGGPPVEQKAIDPIWGTGLAFLVRKGIPEKQARPLIGKLRKAAGDVRTGAILAKAEEDDISDPAPWLMAAAEKTKATGKPSAAADFRNTVYTGTPYDELPPELR